MLVADRSIVHVLYSCFFLYNPHVLRIDHLEAVLEKCLLSSKTAWNGAGSEAETFPKREWS